MANRHVLLQQPEALPEETSGPIAFYCEQAVLSGTYYSATGKAIRRRGTNSKEGRTDQLLSIETNLIEFCFEPQFFRFSQGLFHDRLNIKPGTFEPGYEDKRSDLRSQFSAAFLATTFDDQTTGLGGHAGKETDAAFALTI